MRILSIRLLYLWGSIFCLSASQASYESTMGLSQNINFTDTIASGPNQGGGFSLVLVPIKGGNYDDSIDLSDQAFPTTAHSRSDLIIRNGSMKIMIQPNAGTPFVFGGSSDDADSQGDDANGDDSDDDSADIDLDDDKVPHPTDLLTEVNFRKHKFIRLLSSL